tara:strand:+ start:50 stop:475 length:426 start_codon:yes stop_codon:yes gene_type:complete
MSEVTQHTTLAVQSSVPGDKITFDPLSVKFVVDEDMTNYREIYDWIMAIGPGFDTKDFSTLIDSKKTSSGAFASGNYENMFSDSTLIINTSSNNANVEFSFEDCFPTSLGGIEFASDSDGVEYATCDLTLRYTLFKIKTST